MPVVHDTYHGHGKDGTYHGHGKDGTYHGHGKDGTYHGHGKDGTYHGHGKDGTYHGHGKDGTYHGHGKDGTYHGHGKDGWGRHLPWTRQGRQGKTLTMDMARTAGEDTYHACMDTARTTLTMDTARTAGEDTYHGHGKDGWGRHLPWTRQGRLGKTLTMDTARTALTMDTARERNWKYATPTTYHGHGKDGRGEELEIRHTHHLP